MDVVTGAWRNVPRDQRLCRLCGAGIGDEEHFLFNCVTLNGLREAFLSNVPHDFQSLNNEQYLPNFAKFTFYGLRHFV